MKNLFTTMLQLSTKRLIILAVITAGVFVKMNGRPQPTTPADVAEARAVGFLMREVPAWSKNNGCFSCHNNGDAARALYAATRKGYRIPADVLADTTAWLVRPNRWDQNKGDPGFSDKRLANAQFAASLLAAFETGHVKDLRPLREAARKLAADQAADGAWKIDLANTLGSPATYGTHLATWMALKTLKKADDSGIADAVQKSERWLHQAPPNNVLSAAVLLMTLAGDSDQSARRKQEECLRLIHDAQTGDGGWGPYADSPPEPFDTAIALLALAQVRDRHRVDGWIRRGRAFLAAQQNSDGSWPATTRPPGGESYAQQVSTTGWVTLALLETR